MKTFKTVSCFHTAKLLHQVVKIEQGGLVDNILTMTYVNVMDTVQMVVLFAFVCRQVWS